MGVVSRVPVRRESGQTVYYTPFHLALNAGFIALTWACAHAKILSSPDILDLRLQDRESKLANKNQKNINDILKSW